MGPLELLWLLPLLVAISIVVGATGHDGRREIQASIQRTFRAFLLGVLSLAVIVHVLAVWLT